MGKAEELYMKHIYMTGGTENKQETLAATEVMINEVNIPQKNRTVQPQTLENKENSEISPKSDHFSMQYKNSHRTWNEENRQLPRGSYIHILVNPTQLSDTEFTAWMNRLVEARRNRQQNKPRPYRQFRIPFSQRKGESEESQQQGLRNKLKPAEELNTEELMAHMRCEYVDIEEAVDMYNLNIEECRSA